MALPTRPTLALNQPVPIQIQFDEEKVTSMLNLLKSSRLRTKPPIPTAKKWDLGLELDFITPVKAKFETEWDAKKLEEKVNRYGNYLVKMEEDGTEVELHFVHARSEKIEAVPLLLLHGWPGMLTNLDIWCFLFRSPAGTFLDFHKVMEPLINPPDKSIA